VTLRVADPAPTEPIGTASVPAVSAAQEPDTQSVGSPGAVERARAFTAGPPRLSRRSRIGLVVGLALAIGLATLVNRLGTPGPAHRADSQRHAVIGGAVAPRGASQLKAPLGAFMGASPLHRAPAPAWTLTNALTGTTVSSASLKGRVVVLTFVDAACDDICPVLGQELSDAAASLATANVPVTFVTINTDPLQTDAGPNSPVFNSGDFSSVPGWIFVSGTLRELDRVWAQYGISVTANRSSRRVSHNDVLYIIGPDQTLRDSALPFADESAEGLFSLTAPALSRFGKGLVHYVRQAAG
jgi:protein SCO1/2